MFFFAPTLAKVYKIKEISRYLRVMGLALFSSAVGSIQIAYANHNLDFKSQFMPNMIAILASGVISILMAVKNCGVWALIAQYLIYDYTCTVCRFFWIKWRPQLIFNTASVKKLFAFGWKVFASSILIRINSMVSNLIVGFKYDVTALGFYSKASNYPTAFSDVVVNSISSVTLAGISKIQDDKGAVKERTRQFVRIGFFFIAPLIVGLASFSESFVIIFLTEKWLPCVPYIQVFCLVYLFQPLCAIFGQTLSGIGRSDKYLKIFIIVKPIGLIFTIFAAALFDSPIYIALSLVVASFLESAIQSAMVKKYISYSMSEILRDWLPSVAYAFIMYVAVSVSKLIPVGEYLSAGLQVLAGALTYVIVAFLFKDKTLNQLWKMVKDKGEK